MDHPFTVYRIRVQRDRFQTLELADSAAFYRRFPRPFQGEPMLGEDSDDPFPCRIVHPERPAADCSYLMPGTFVIRLRREWRTNVVAQAVCEGCEILDVDVEGERRIAVNPRVCNALDKSASLVKRDADGRVTSITRYAFHPHRIEWNLFRLPETAPHEIYTCSGSVTGRGYDPEMAIDDEFPLGYAADAMTGLEFEPVWSVASRT